MKATIDIDKVKVKSGLFLEVDYKKNFDEGKVRNIVHEQCNAPIHEDLSSAFTKLVPHLAILTEYLDEQAVPQDIEHWDNPQLEHFKVTQISIGGDGEGVTITGQRKLKTGKVLNLNAPFTKYYEEDGYRFGADLQIAVDNILTEVEAYMDGKHGEGAQLSMSFEGDGGGEGENEEEEM